MTKAIGKQIADKCYIHVSRLCELQNLMHALISRASQLASLTPNSSFNVIRIREQDEEVAFLHYADFFEAPFPALTSSWRIHLPTELVRFRDYSQSLNPPVLHRKELLVSEAHPDHATWAALTATAESLGLFDDPVRIGFKMQWEECIHNHGYRIDGHALVPIGNFEPSADEHGRVCDPLPSSSTTPFIQVQRHLTALTRTSLSAPIQNLLRHELLTPQMSFFDYGCGKGDDLRGLLALGIAGTGWDPYHRPEGARCEADVVNLGFVINVIEDFDERIAALLGAFALCRRVLAVSAMLEGTHAGGATFRDGILTGRRTFQKYYTQAQLQQFIESVLEEEAISAAPGVFYVFRNRVDEQHFWLKRQSNRTRCVRAILRTPVPHHRTVRRPRSTVLRETASPAPDPECLSLAFELWSRCLELGRIPEPDEVFNLEALAAKFGGLNKGLRFCFRHHDSTALERSAQSRREDLLVCLAVARFSRQQRFHDLDRTLQRDIKALFGSLTHAEQDAQQLLFSVSDTVRLNAACEEAVRLGLGHLEPGQSLQLHTSLVERLPAILRVYVACGTALFGDITGTDLIKLHIQTGKITLMRFDDFVHRPLPKMTERIKIRLREQDMQIFEYGESFPPPYLYDKSRFVNEEFPNYPEQLAFEASLRRLNLFELSGYGPTPAVFEADLTRARWEVSGFRLQRLHTIPALDAPCSRCFKYRELIEVGETWQRTHTPNVPCSPDTYNALADLARLVLDPVVEYYGRIEVTYGFSSASLGNQIARGIEPKLDQHGSHEVSPRGKPICGRGGAAVDFLVRDENMLEVVDWIASHVPFDRLYYYGPSRPIHVSYTPDGKREIVEMQERNGRRFPHRRRIIGAPGLASVDAKGQSRGGDTSHTMMRPD